jgi:acetyl-CoA carboxylase alpha subunit|tara:strand:+ start:807 stop:1091 length:285 start_codon:yes stop_codon:yes gene_type:complete
MSNQENNKMIAEFMGIVYPKLNNVIVIDNVVIKEDELQYHISWDWLMPVVEKIEDYLSDNVGEIGYFDECLNSNILDIRYQAVVEFIKEYNKNK